MSKQRKGCIDKTGFENHKTQTITCVDKNPEVFVIKVNWADWPSPS